MKLDKLIYLVGSGSNGFNMTHNLDCHVYLINAGGELALIDTGIGIATQEIIENIKQEGFLPEKISKILITHVHADHAGGAAQLKDQLDCEVMVSKRTADFLRIGDEDAINLTFGKQAGFYPENYDFEPCEVDRELNDNDIIQIGDFQIQVIDTPGHCRGHIALHFKAENKSYLLDGDCIFWGGKILLQNIYDCILQDYIESIKKLAKLDVDVFLPGHGCFSLKEGKRHIDLAAESIKNLGVPPNLI